MAIKDFFKHAAEGPARRPNPLLNKRRANPLFTRRKEEEKKAEEVKAEAEDETEAVEVKKEKPVKRVSPLTLQKLKKEAVDVKPEPQKEEEKEEKKQPKSNLINEDEPISGAGIDDIEQPNPTAVDDEDNTETDDTPIVEVKTEIKHRRRRRTHAEVLEAKAAKEREKEESRRKAAEAANKKALERAAKETKKEAAPVPVKKEQSVKEEADNQVLVSDYRPIDIFDQEVSPEEAAGILADQYESEDFRELEKEIIDRLKKIKITSDMNTGTLKYTLMDLDALNSEVMFHLIEARKVINAWTDKEYGPLTAYRIEHSVGKNELERKRNAFAALASADIKGHKVNILALVTSAKMQLEFFQGTADTIRSKQQMLITMNSALKMENSNISMGSQS